MSDLSSQRVVITGVGPISVIGIGRAAFFAGLQAGDTAPAAGDALPVEGFAVEDYLQSEKTYLDRCSQFALAAASLALEDAQLDWRGDPHPRWGVALGTAFGCLDSMLSNTTRVLGKGMRFASPIIFMHSLANSPASLVAIEYGLEGPNPTFCDAGISAGSALNYAWHALATGQAEVMVAGGVDVLSAPLMARLDAGADWVEYRPVAEGAAMLVLEQASFAAARGATPLAELVGCALAAGTNPDEGRRRALESAAAAGGGNSPPIEFDARRAYGYAFGASLALDVVAAISLGELGTGEKVSIARATPSGRAGAVILREPI